MSSGKSDSAIFSFLQESLGEADFGFVCRMSDEVKKERCRDRILHIEYLRPDGSVWSPADAGAKKR